MPPIVTDRVAWSVGLSVGLSSSELCEIGWSDRDAACVEDSVGPGKHNYIQRTALRRILYCVHSTQYSHLDINAKTHQFKTRCSRPNQTSKTAKKTVFGFSNLASNTDALKCIPQFLTIQLYKIWFWLCLHLQKLYDTFFVNQQYQMYPK